MIDKIGKRILAHYHIIIFGLSIFSLSLAYVAEYMFNITPCMLCIYQRFPYLILISLSIFSLGFVSKGDIFKKYLSKNILLYYLAVYLISIAIAFYHSGVERGVFELSSICSTSSEIKSDLSTYDISSVEAFHKLLDKQHLVPCNKPQIAVFGISMTEWNLLLNLGLFLVSLYLFTIIPTKILS